MSTPHDKKTEYIENHTFDEIEVGDSASLDAKQRAKTAARSRLYLKALGNPLPAEIREAFRLTEERLSRLEAGLGAN